MSRSVDVEDVKSFFNVPDNYLHKRFGIRLRKDLLQKLVPKKSYKTLLDVGCGDGSLSIDFLSTCDSASLIDVSSSMLKLAQSNIERAGFRNKINFIEGDFLQTSFANKFELVLLVGVLAHVPDVEKVFSKLQDIVAEKGIVAVQFTDSNNFFLKFKRASHQYNLNQTSYALIETLIARYGFKIRDTRRYMIPFPGMRLFSDGFLYNLQRAILSLRFLAMFTSDYMIVIEKK